MAELSYPYTQVAGSFPPDGYVEINVSIAHINGDPVVDQDVVDAVKAAVSAAGGVSVSATTYSLTSAPA